MRTIAVLNQKGGVGKTTTVVNTAAALAVAGAKVVVIDLDPQAHLTIHLGLEPQSIQSSSYRILTQSATFDGEIMMVRPNLWLLPANIDLVGAESELVSIVGRETILREAMESSEETFDYCLIDCAPSLGLLTLNALAAVEEVLIPLQPHFLALQGFGKLLQTIELVNKRINPGLKVYGVLLCMFDSRASLPNEVKADIEQFVRNARGTGSAWANAIVLPTFIRRNIKLAEAPSYGKTIFEYEQNCNGAEDYRKVAQYIHVQSQAPPEAYLPEPAEAAEIQFASEPLEPQPAPAYADENQSESSVQTEQFPQDDFQTQQEMPEELKPSPSQKPPDHTDEIRESPPIEIKEIQPSDSHVTKEFTQTTGESNQPETGGGEY